MITFYFNQKGEKVTISEMPDAYLLNALAHYRKRRQDLIAKRHTLGFPAVAKYLQEVQALVDALSFEVGKRGILNTS